VSAAGEGRVSAAGEGRVSGAGDRPGTAPRLGDVAEQIAEDRERELEPSDEDVEEAPALDPEIAARRAAALTHVRKFGDPALRTRARPVERIDDTLRAEIARMGELMSDALGVGLAATQLGVLHRVLVYRVQHGAPVNALINPEVEWRGGDAEIAEEGCLSLPGVLVDVERPVHVRVRAFDEQAQPILIEASGLEARVIQHEVDHLDGVLILDRTTREQRKEAMRALREAQQAA
jgi:peptide deformylase